MSSEVYVSKKSSLACTCHVWLLTQAESLLVLMQVVKRAWLLCSDRQSALGTHMLLGCHAVDPCKYVGRQAEGGYSRDERHLTYLIWSLGSLRERSKAAAFLTHSTRSGEACG
jgi:hypothetical protein